MAAASTPGFLTQHSSLYAYRQNCDTFSTATVKAASNIWKNN